MKYLIAYLRSQWSVEIENVEMESINQQRWHYVSDTSTSSTVWGRLTALLFSFSVTHSWSCSNYSPLMSGEWSAEIHQWRVFRVWSAEIHHWRVFRVWSAEIHQRRVFSVISWDSSLESIQSVISWDSSVEYS